MKKVLKTFGIAVLVILCAAILFFAVIVATEYKPGDVEDTDVQTVSDSAVFSGDTVSVMTFNIGYAGLSKNADFFMDGGNNVTSCDKEQVQDNIAAVTAAVLAQDTDFVFLQEVDTSSTRTYGINERNLIGSNFANNTYAYNYKCLYVPYPLPPIGKVNSGIMTMSDYTIESGERISLPCPFSWPISAANLKRCLLVSRVPIEGSDKELVLVNLHLEAYDDGEGKVAQTRQLIDFIVSEYEKGNYVIAGGDFNQTFPGGLDAFPITDSENWVPGVLDADALPEGWSYACDTSCASCRLNDAPYTPGVNQVYLIDGFIISPNLELESVKTIDLGFENSDHNPVRLDVTLK